MIKNNNNKNILPPNSNSIFFMKSERRRLWSSRAMKTTLPETAKTAMNPTPTDPLDSIFFSSFFWVSSIFLFKYLLTIYNVFEIFIEWKKWMTQEMRRKEKSHFLGYNDKENNDEMSCWWGSWFLYVKKKGKENDFFIF